MRKRKRYQKPEMEIVDDRPTVYQEVDMPFRAWVCLLDDFCEAMKAVVMDLQDFNRRTEAMLKAA